MRLIKRVRKSNLKTYLLGVRLPIKTASQMLIRAKNEGLLTSEWIRKLIEKELKEKP